MGSLRAMGTMAQGPEGRGPLGNHGAGLWDLGAWDGAGLCHGTYMAASHLFRY